MAQSLLMLMLMPHTILALFWGSLWSISTTITQVFKCRNRFFFPLLDTLLLWWHQMIWRQFFQVWSGLDVCWRVQLLLLWTVDLFKSSTLDLKDVFDVNLWRYYRWEHHPLKDQENWGYLVLYTLEKNNTHNLVWLKYPKVYPNSKSVNLRY